MAVLDVYLIETDGLLHLATSSFLPYASDCEGEGRCSLFLFISSSQIAVTVAVAGSSLVTSTLFFSILALAPRAVI